MARQLGNGNVLCEQCGNEYQRIAQHWSKGSVCGYPEIHPYLKEIITGLMMGDGCLLRESKNPHLVVGMTSPNYLEYINDIFGWMSRGFTLSRTAEECAKYNRDSGFHSEAKAENYSDVYVLRSMHHPDLKYFNWYGSGRKVWPADIELTPAALTHWYVGDGSWRNDRSSCYIRINMTNESSYTDKVTYMFERAGLPTPSYVTYERPDGSITCSATWTVEGSHELWSYMETPPPDFHYKFPEKYHTPHPTDSDVYPLAGGSDQSTFSYSTPQPDHFGPSYVFG